MVQLTTSLVAALVTLCPLILATPSKLEARYPNCDRANVGFGHTKEAVQCINQLAALGSTPCVTDYGGRKLRTCGGTLIWSVSRVPRGARTTCENVAKTLGRIMDVCNRPDDNIQGNDFVFGNGDFYVEIRANF
ncbi:hypothetical protein BKA65DRAFT_512055 [Rhexocercosporidium sp. MPI-PUGE-AT-0058]|nr:hypothetical protein BKA65DRAFT_512055 [Rhexocercosporidium sp. MPI-PUGE-AT-0058]